MKNDKSLLFQTAEARLPYENTSALYLALIERFANIEDGALSTLAEIQSRDVGPLPLAHYSSERSKPGSGKRVLITAGFHGDEPAGVLALLRFLERHREEFPEYTIHAFPCLNPIGFARRHRLGSTHHDLNRVIDPHSIAPEVRYLIQKLQEESAPYDAVLDLHEDNPEVACDFAPSDPTPDGFYLYESARTHGNSLSSAIVNEVRRVGFPVSTWKAIYGDRAQDGVITSSKRKAGLYDFERFAVEALAHSVITAETPMDWELEDRVAAQVAVIRGALNALGSN